MYRVMQEHLLTFEQQWTDEASGHTLPAFVTEELHKFLDCGILARGFAHLYCDTCHEHYAVAFSCKARAVCPSCFGRRMNECALNLVDHVLPDVPIRQFVLTVPFPLRFPLAFDGKLIGQVVRIFTDAVAGWYRCRHVARGLPAGETGSITVIQRANSDLRLNPHLHTIFLDGVYSPDADGNGQMFHPAPAPTQDEVEALVGRTSKRILRFLQRRGVLSLVAAPGDGEVSVVADESIGEEDPLLAKLLAAATAGAEPAGPGNQRKVIRIVHDPDAPPVAKGNLCAQAHAFNLHAATKVAANDKQGRLALCRYILRPPLANDRLTIIDDDHVRLDFKKPWSDGTASVELPPLKLIARLAALVPPPKRHTSRYFGVLSSHASLRSRVVPAPELSAAAPVTKPDKPPGKSDSSRYIPWAELVRRTFGFEIVCDKCHGQLRLIALVKSYEVAQKVLTAMHLPTEAPEPFPLYLTGDWLALARSPPVPPRFAQQSWATLAPKGEGERQDSTARQTGAPQVEKTVGERGSSCRLSQVARTDERASSPHTPQGWAYQDQKSFAKGARDPNS